MININGKKLKIAFHSEQMHGRGAEVALYDYAFYNRSILGNESIIIYDLKSPFNNSNVVEKFKESFSVYAYNTFDEVDSMLKEHEVDLLYMLKLCYDGGRVSRFVPTMVHDIVPQVLSRFHGSSYAFISKWLSDVCSNGQVPYVPHMIHLPKTDENLRHSLNIPMDATVFGCIASFNSFDIKFVKKNVIPKILRERSNIYFIFLHTPPFIEHKRAIFLPFNIDSLYKVKFINTSDAMLHARQAGESFGLACAEFSYCNKPILTYEKSPYRNHLMVLGSKALLYSDTESLRNIIVNFDRKTMAAKNWDCYSEPFSPEKTMKLFNSKLIAPALENGLANRRRVRFVELSVKEKILMFHWFKVLPWKSYIPMLLKHPLLIKRSPF